jgi:hypothetical protein
MDLIARWGLGLELRRWRRLGRKPVLWWRDDDAREPSPALDRLLALAGDIPLSLAIVPDGDLRALARTLSPYRNLTFSQHGVDHHNRAPDGAAASEYPFGTSVADMAVRIEAGREAMTHADLTPRFYTPPWNAVDPRLPEALRQAGFSSISARAPSEPLADLARADIDLDILRWKPRPRFRGDARIMRRLTRLLARRRRTGAYAEPIGLLTHHLVHDDLAWSFLGRFLAAARRDFVWRAFPDVAAPRAGPIAASWQETPTTHSGCGTR